MVQRPSVAQRKPPPERTTVGWREWVALPDWGVPAIKAKVDTGARTSALHAFDIETFERDGSTWARFLIHPWQDSGSDEISVEAPLKERRSVRSSSGASRLRPVVTTSVELAGSLVPIEVTLTRRDEMGFRMLIGRQALRRRFLVDPGRSYLGGKPARHIIDRNRGRA
jgi:hypothetical protein